MWTHSSLDPDEVSRSLVLTPDQAWRKGDTRRFADYVHSYPHGGWRRDLPESIKDQLFEQQLEYWVELLQNRVPSFRELHREGNACVLSCFITTNETASIALPI